MFKKIVSIGLKIIAIPTLLKLQKLSYILVLKSVLTDKYVQKDGFVLSNYGIWLKDNPSDRTFRLGLLGYRNRLDRFLKDVSTEMIFLDIGSNQGVFTLVSSKNKNFSEIHSFEPNPHIFKILKDNVDKNECARVVLHNKAITHTNGMIGFDFKETHSGAGKIDTSAMNLLVESVNHEYLDTLLQDSNHPLFIKIDVEGAEYEVLKEIKLMSKFNDVRSIFIELNDSLSNVFELRNFLFENNFIQIFEKETRKNRDGFFIRVN